MNRLRKTKQAITSFISLHIKYLNITINQYKAFKINHNLKKKRNLFQPIFLLKKMEKIYLNLIYICKVLLLVF